MTHRTTPLLSWYQMTPRAQAVWGAAYAGHPSPGPEAARHADDVVISLALSDWPEKDMPEHRAARLVRSLTLEEFRGWYLVELQLMQPGRPPPSVSEAQIQDAYTTYLMCGSDFS